MISSRPMTTNILKVYVRPNSRETSVEGLYKGRIKIRVASPPQKGKANKELIVLLSSLTGISKSKFSIISGITSNYKDILVNEGRDLDFIKMILQNNTE